jgi:hypothetical protein
MSACDLPLCSIQRETPVCSLSRPEAGAEAAVLLRIATPVRLFALARASLRWGEHSFTAQRPRDQSEGQEAGLLS